MKSDWDEYIAAGILHAVRNERTWTPEKLAEFFEEQFGFEVTAESIIAAVDILSDCGIAFNEDDPFAGRFIKLSRSRYKLFLESVERERDPSYEPRKEPINQSVAISYSLYVNRTPNLSKYNGYKILKRYHEFGGEFILSALRQIADGATSSHIVPASDRVVLSSDNVPLVQEISCSLEKIQKELAQSNEAGLALGDLRPLAIDELRQLGEEVNKPAIRAKALLLRARETLGWLVKRCADSSISELAKQAIKLFIDWLT